MGGLQRCARGRQRCVCQAPAARREKATVLRLWWGQGSSRGLPSFACESDRSAASFRMVLGAGLLLARPPNSSFAGWPCRLRAVGLGQLRPSFPVGCPCAGRMRKRTPWCRHRPQGCIHACLFARLPVGVLCCLVSPSTGFLASWPPTPKHSCCDWYAEPRGQRVGADAPRPRSQCGSGLG